VPSLSLSNEADSDLQDILDYSIPTFGVDRAERYYLDLKECLNASPPSRASVAPLLAALVRSSGTIASGMPFSMRSSIVESSSSESSTSRWSSDGTFPSE
jgi:hypothetical protein